MRVKTVSSGVKLISGGIVSVILATYFHEHVAAILRFSQEGETRFIFLGLFLGGGLGFCGILITVIGFLLTPLGVERKSLLPVLCFLIAVVFIFFMLLLHSFTVKEHPRLLPGESITI